MVSPIETAIANCAGSVARIACGDTGSMGTAFFVTSEIALTCDHVVSIDRLTSRGTIVHDFSRDIRVHTADGREIPASVVSSAVSTEPYAYDYAVLHCPAAAARALTLGTYEDANVGEEVVILGHPFGIGHLIATRAMIAAKAQVLSPRNSLFAVDVLELDGSVNSGNSGGPAVSTTRNEVLGIVSVRHGSIQARVDLLRQQVQGTMVEALFEPLLDILEMSNTFMNPGLGRANSLAYARRELATLGIVI
ncbi:MAG TPA: serine protease [Dehalococcoidia bacterium]|nr:serine protease [Dehalococcoidia bacterium]